MEKYRINPDDGLEFGIYTLGDHIPHYQTGERLSAQERLLQIIEIAKMAEEAGVDFFGVGESHQPYFVSQAHGIILSAIVSQTKRLKVGSTSTIVSTSDPVRIYEDFATLDLLSGGRVELIGGRASRVGLFELLGYDIRHYEALFEEKFELLLEINKKERITWEGEFRAPLRGAEIIPRPLAGELPIWRAVGGHASSAIKAGKQGVPMTLATLGGSAIAFKRSVDAYRESLESSGYDPNTFPVATAGLFYVADTMEDAIKEAYPHINYGIQLVNGRGFPRTHFEQSRFVDDVLNVGPADHIIEKILYQHEQFGHQRYMAQLDFGGMSIDQIKRNIDVLGSEIIPAVKKYTKKQKKE